MLDWGNGLGRQSGVGFIYLEKYENSAADGPRMAAVMLCETSWITAEKF